MKDLATRHRSGFMSPNQVRNLSLVRGLVDPVDLVSLPPTLDYDFTNLKGAPFYGNLTRATVGGLRQAAKGTLIATTNNEPNIDFSAGTALGTGFYGAYTNLALWSEDQSNAAYTKTNITVGANAAVAPDGTATADSLTRASNATSHVVQAISAAIDSVVTRSVYAKAKSAGNRFGVRLQGTYPHRAEAIFDLATGSVVGSAGSTYTGVSASIEDFGNGWYRCNVTATAAGSALQSIVHGPCDGGHSVGGFEAASVTLSDCYVWGEQTAATAFPVPYVPTTSATVARNADSMIISGTDFTDFYNSTEGTLYAEATISYATTSFPSIAVLDDGTSANRAIMVFDAANNRMEISTGTSSSLQAYFTPSVTRGTFIKTAFSLKANSFAASLNGAVALTDNSGTMPPGLNRLQIGGAYGAWSEHIRRLIYWPKALDAVTLQRITA